MIPQLQREAPVSAASEPTKWSLATRIGFRFTFVYFLLYVAPGPIGSRSSYQTLDSLQGNPWVRLCHAAVTWVGTTFFSLPANDLREIPNGSGDQLYDYVLIVCLIIAAALATLVWSWLDRKRPNYEGLYRWLRFLMRMTLAWAMLGYGVKKLVGAQFTPPTLARQAQAFGRATPMNMLWTFMGASQAYSLFGGIGETLGGVLLLIPRLTTLGALVSFAMMANVLMLNLCYDVPRKIFSIHLVLMCLFLLLPEMRRLANVFIFNRKADPVPEVPLMSDKVLNWAALALPIVFGASIAYLAGSQSISDLKSETAALPPPIRGVWTVNQLALDGIIQPLVITNGPLWQQLIFDSPSVLVVQSMDGRQQSYNMNIDSQEKAVHLVSTQNPRFTGQLTLDLPTPDTLVLQGKLGAQQVNAKLNRVNMSDPQQYPMMNRGFHWVNPFVNNP